jgi:predicted nucleotidyltransferase
MAKRDARTREARLATFAAAVAGAAGDNLVSLTLYGSAARGALRETSDMNLILVLRDASAEVLKPLGRPFREWLRAGERPPLVFSADGWRAAADVFPIEIEDIRRSRRVLHGTDPVAHLTTRREDLRRELEREARGALVQLRAAYLAAAGDGRELADLVIGSCRTILVLARATLRIAGTEPPEDPAALVSAVAGAAGFSAAAFEWPLAQLAVKHPPGLEPYDPRAARYLDAIANFVEYVDRL